MLPDPGKCPHCGGESNGIVMYSLPAQTTCKDCGRRWAFGEGLQVLSEEEGRQKRPGFYASLDPVEDVLRPFVTEAIAREIREVRAAGNSWRSVAVEIARRYPDSPVVSDHPEYGETLCHLAGVKEGD